MKLRPYQLEAIAAVRECWASGERNAIISMATGCGKTVIFADLAREQMAHGRVMTLAHRDELIEQARDKMTHWTGVRPALEKAEHYADRGMHRDSPLVVSSFQTQAHGQLKRCRSFNPSDFSMVIADECFPAGTLVDGRRIERIRVGDLVKCWDHKKNMSVYRPVLNLFRRNSSDLVRITLSDHSRLICTASHPVWSDTRGKYVAAGLLDSRDMVLKLITYEQNPYSPPSSSGPALHHLRNHRTLRGETRQGNGQEGSSILLASLLTKRTCSLVVPADGQDKPKVRLGQNDGQQPDGQTRDSGQSVRGDGGKIANNSRRKRQAAKQARGGTGGGAGVENKPPRQNDGNAHGLPIGLQDRRGQRGHEDSNRSGRRIARNTDPADTGSEKRVVLTLVGVDRVEVYQQTGGRKSRGVRGGSPVYNIEVAEHNNYFADGVLVHNCHHNPAKSHKAVIDHYMRNPNCKLLGVTATCDRADKKKLHGTVCYQYDIDRAIKDGYLVPMQARRYKIEGMDFTRIKHGGDFTEGDLDQIIREEKTLHGITCAAIEAAFRLPRYWMRTCENPELLSQEIAEIKPRSTIIFLPARESVEQTPLTKLTADILNRWVPGCARPIDGNMDKEIRRATIDDFKAGRFAFLCGCMVPTEGFDAPCVSCVVVARPTKSRGLYAQMVGRGTRPAESVAGVLSDIESADSRRQAIAASEKPDLLIVDLVGNTGQHKLITAAHLFCVPGRESAINTGEVDDANPMDQAADASKLFDQVAEFKDAIEKLEAQRVSRAIENAMAEPDILQRELDRVQARLRVIGVASLDYREVDVLGNGTESEPEPMYASQVKSGLSVSNPDLYQKLCGMGVNPMTADKYGERQGWTVLVRMRDKQCTLKQARFLKVLGYQDSEIAEMNFKQACKAIEASKGAEV